MSSVRGSQCLHQAELFPLSAGPAGGLQGGSPCELEKQVELTNMLLMSFFFLQNSFVMCLSLGGGQERRRLCAY